MEENTKVPTSEKLRRNIRLLAWLMDEEEEVEKNDTFQTHFSLKCSHNCSGIKER